MRAAVCREYGPPEIVQVEDVAPPTPDPGQVHVRIRAAAVNYPDVLLIANRYQMRVPTPFVPGSEFAGDVVEIGQGVTGIALGTPVFGTTLVGAFAEEVVVAASAVTPVPDGVAHDVAAAFGVAHRTAYHVLRSVAKVQAGDELIVLGAGGGVGLAAVQLGSVIGATVTAVASTTDKLAVAESHGAGRLVNHREGDLRAALRQAVPAGADAVIDPVGGDLAEPALRSLKWGGRFVTVGYASGDIPRIPLNLVLLKGVQVLGFQFGDFVTHAQGEYRRNEDELLALLAAGRALPYVGARFSLDESASALRQVAEGRALGKVIIEIASGDTA